MRTLAEKQRQNAFWLRRIERIGSALAALADNGLRMRLEAHAGLAELLAVFEHQIGRQLAGWRTQQLDISATLKAFLYRLREVAQKMGKEARLIGSAAERSHAAYLGPERRKGNRDPAAWLALLSARRHVGKHAEADAFLEWLVHDHFTFLGFEEFSVEEQGGVSRIVYDEGSLLGLSKMLRQGLVASGLRHSG